MPFKFNASRRHHILRAKYRVTNWSEYNHGLVSRSDIRIRTYAWLSHLRFMPLYDASSGKRRLWSRQTAEAPSCPASSCDTGLQFWGYHAGLGQAFWDSCFLETFGILKIEVPMQKYDGRAPLANRQNGSNLCNDAVGRKSNTERRIKLQEYAASKLIVASKSLPRLLLRLIHVKKRSATHRIGRPTNPV